MHAIASHIKKTNGHRRVLYLSAEKFMYQFVRALRNDETVSFRDLFRSVDVLMIDDIQFICGKKATQEEFFHTFNALIDQGKQIVLSSDSSPLELKGIEDRLKTRMAQGLVVDIYPTTYEMRIGILQTKAALLNVTVPQDVIEFLAEKITTNVRELEGALKRIVASTQLLGMPITLDNTKSLLRDLLHTYEKELSISDIQKTVADYYTVRLTDLKSTRKDRKIARPRQIAMYLSKTLTTKSLPEIGRSKHKCIQPHAVDNRPFKPSLNGEYDNYDYGCNNQKGKERGESLKRTGPWLGTEDPVHHGIDLIDKKYACDQE